MLCHCACTQFFLSTCIHRPHLLVNFVQSAWLFSFFFFLFPLPFLLEERFVCWPLAWGGTGMQCMPRPRSISCCCSPLRRHGSSTSSSEMRQLPKRLDFYGGGKSPIFLTVNLCGVTVLEICWFRGMCVLFIGCCGRER